MKFKQAEKEFITFKQAKRFAQIGFDQIQSFGNVASLYDKKGNHVFYTNYGFMYSGLSDGYISAPEQSFMVEWLRLNAGLFISVKMHDAYTREPNASEYDDMYIAVIRGHETRFDWAASIIPFKKRFKSPQEAYSKAFDYVLESRIKQKPKKKK